MRKFFKNLLKPQKDNAESKIEEDFKYLPSKDDLVEEKFTKNFTNNGGKFLYASNKDEFLEYYGGLIEWNNQEPKLVLRREQYYHFSRKFNHLSNRRFEYLFKKYEKTFI